MFIPKIVMLAPLFLMNEIVYGSALSASLECNDFKLPTFHDTLSFSIGGCSINAKIDAIKSCEEAMIEHVTDFRGMLSTSLSYGCESTSENNFDDRLYDAAFFAEGGFFDRTSYTVSKDGSHYFSGGKTTLETKEIIARDTNSFSYTGKREENQHEALSQSANTDNCTKETTELSMECSFKESSNNQNIRREEDDNATRMQTDKLFNVMIIANSPTMILMSPSEKIRESVPSEEKNRYFEFASRVISSTSITKGHFLGLSNFRNSMDELTRENAAIIAVPTFDKLTHDIISTRKDLQLP